MLRNRGNFNLVNLIESLKSGATLYQLPGAVNRLSGRYEWIVNEGAVTHRLFVLGGTLNGIPITP